MVSDYELAKLSGHVYNYGSLVVDNARGQVDVIDGFSVATIAGTNDRRDWIQNTLAFPWRPRELESWVHFGFWRHFKPLMRPMLVEIYQNGKPVICAGHSLGGIVAGYLAAVCTKKGIPVERLTTFGAPRGGYSSYCSLTEGIAGRRYVREGDQVAWVPAPGILFPWRHDRDAFELKGEDGLFDHDIKGYTQELKIIEAHQ